MAGNTDAPSGIIAPTEEKTIRNAITRTILRFMTDVFSKLSIYLLRKRQLSFSEWGIMNE
jgi:hypothetical protein